MYLRSSKKILQHVEDIVHDKTQVHEKSIDLTVDSVYRFTQPGALDFGGSEFEPAATEIIEPQKENSNDDYGWWKLDRGYYKAVFNEHISLDEDMLAIIAPHDHARQAGLLTNTALLAHGDTSILTFQVPEMGCNIKENARIATAYLLYI
ncbi:MAG TPA: hypothetical protein VE868_01595 [Balneolaceae bacterium]|nr:hypothetical protein [Balneolaceae bacterium]